jgi:hypothetical protein
MLPVNFINCVGGKCKVFNLRFVCLQSLCLNQRALLVSYMYMYLSWLICMHMIVWVVVSIADSLAFLTSFSKLVLAKTIVTCTRFDTMIFIIHSEYIQLAIIIVHYNCC